MRWLFVQSLLLALLLQLVGWSTSQAPGDAHTKCTDSAQHPVYPNHTRVLMDTADYQNLIGDTVNDSPAPVWQTVNWDGNVEPSLRVNWEETVYSGCDHQVEVCQDCWLITQHINRTRSDGFRQEHVAVTVEFSFNGCTAVECSTSFSIFKYDTSVIDPAAARTLSNYGGTPVAKIPRPNGSGSQKKNITFYLDFGTGNQEIGFYLAFHEKNCISIFHVLVFYDVHTEDKFELPKVLALFYTYQPSTESTGSIPNAAVIGLVTTLGCTLFAILVAILILVLVLCIYHCITRRNSINTCPAHGSNGSLLGNELQQQEVQMEEEQNSLIQRPTEIHEHEHAVGLPLPTDDTATYKEKVLSPSINLSENHTEFIDPVETIHCDTSGGVYHNPIHGITLRIPEGAVPHETELDIHIGVCLDGKFAFPGDFTPVSAIVWLHSQSGDDFQFLKPIELIIPHFLDSQSVEDTCFLKASSQTTGAIEFRVHPLGLSQMDFTSLDARGILHTQHFCYNCIAEKISEEKLKREKFEVTCAVPDPIISRSIIYFYFTYDIPTCYDNLVRLLHDKKQKLCIKEQRSFHFAGRFSGRKITSKFSTSGDSVQVTLQPRVVKMKELDFWQLEKDEKLKYKIDKGQYPPNMRLRIGELSPTKEQTISVTFKGTQESEMYMAIHLLIPISESNASLHNQPTHQVQAREESIPDIQDKPTLRQLTLLKSSPKIQIINKLAVKWQDLGVMMDFDCDGDTVQIVRNTNEREGPTSCCKEIFRYWLKGKGRYQPASWKNLVELLKDTDETHLAEKLCNYILSQDRPRTTSPSPAGAETHADTESLIETSIACLGEQRQTPDMYEMIVMAPTTQQNTQHGSSELDTET